MEIEMEERSKDKAKIMVKMFFKEMKNKDESKEN
jgi:hypothetical protein